MKTLRVPKALVLAVIGASTTALVVGTSCESSQAPEPVDATKLGSVKIDAGSHDGSQPDTTSDRDSSVADAVADAAADAPPDTPPV